MPRTLRQLFMRSVLRLTAVAFWLIITSTTVIAGQFRVIPSGSIVFDENQKSSMVTVVNEGLEPVTIDISSVKWDQDNEGRDLFAETQELVVFPKAMTLEKAEERVIRVGCRGALAEKEKAYRIIIGERSGAAKRESGGGPAASPVSIPVFIKPMALKVAGSSQRTVLSHGQLTIRVNNAGNAHLIVIALSLRGVASNGREIFNRELAGAYVLSGISKSFRTAIPGQLCERLSRVEVQIKTNSELLSGTLDVAAGRCESKNER